ncbi:MAG: hypothetical protein HY840_03805 [Bacteroidetes bacterium]|nr:hypothetical protein [Bacteroidota bacterium]
MTTNLLQIADEKFWDHIHKRHQDKGGVYKMIAVRNEQRVPINRFLGTDNEGVLYIGKATSYVDRVIELKKSIAADYKGTGHICGRRYKSNPKIAKQFPYEHLFVELIQTDKPEEKEKELLEAYFITYGEVPPLNAIL